MKEAISVLELQPNQLTNIRTVSRLKRSIPIMADAVTNEVEKTLTEAVSPNGKVKEEEKKKENQERQDKTPQETERQKQLREMWLKESGGVPTPDQEALIKMGVPPKMGGGAPVPREQFIQFEPAVYTDATVRNIAEQVKQSGEAGLLDETKFTRQLTRLESLIDEGRVNEHEARNLINLMDGWEVQARAANRGGQARRQRADEAEEELTDEEIRTIDRQRIQLTYQQLLTIWLAHERKTDEKDLSQDARDAIMRGDDPTSASQRKERKRYYLPDSLQEVCVNIMEQEKGKFAAGQEWALLKIDPVTGRQEFIKENFLRWIRHKILFLSSEDSDNPQINFFGEIKVQGNMRDYNIIEMTRNPGNFFKDKYNPSNINYDLANDVLNEIYAVATGRNTGINYKFVMGDDSKLAGALSQMYERSVYTKAGILESLLRMDSTVTQEEAQGHDLKLPKSQAAGQSFRAAMLMYYYMSDPEMLKQIAGENNLFFSNKDFVKDYVKAKIDRSQKILEGQNLENEKKSLTEEADRLLAPNRSFFDNDGNGDVIREKIGDYVNGDRRGLGGINIFQTPSEDVIRINQVRERIRLTMIRRFNINYIDAEYIENLAYNMTGWTGAAARNDRRTRAHDAWEKVLHTSYYRRNQAEDSRIGMFGNEYNVYGIKRLGVDWFTGLSEVKDDPYAHRRSILEIFQGGQGNKVDFNEEIGKNSIRFGYPAMSQFAVNHITRTFNLFHKLTESDDFNFDNYVKWGGPFQGWVFDKKKADEALRDGVFKDIRYAYQNTSDLDYTKKVRIWERDDKGDYDYKEMYVAEMMFGKQILKKWLNDKGEMDEKKVMDKDTGLGLTASGRRDLWKEVLKYLIKTEIYAHRVRGSGREYYDLYKLEKVYAYLENLGANLTGSEKDFKEVKLTANAFSKEFLDEIRKETGTQRWKLYMVQGGIEIGAGFVGGLFKGIQDAVKSAVKP